MTDKELVAELEVRIKDYADAYYKGEEKISDAEYDRLIEMLRKVKPDSELLGVAGSDIIGVSKKVKLPVTMGTLAKCNTSEDFKEWWNKHDTKNLVAEKKIDGCLDYDTLLDTNKGKLKIGDIVENKILCKVLGYNMSLRKNEYSDVEAFMINENNSDWYTIELENGQNIKITGNHYVWLPELECWRQVKDLKVGDSLLIKD